MKTIIFLITVFSVLQIGCQGDVSSQYQYHLPEKLNDGFETGTLAEANIDEDLVTKAVNEIYQGKYKEIHSMLIYKSGKLVLEEYFPGHDYQWEAPYHLGEWVNWDEERLHQVQSVTKSITSTCVGIAVDHGFIKSVHQSIFDYLPGYEHFKKDGKKNITIEHLLTMTSGLQWDEWSAPLSSVENDIIGVWFSEKDPVTYILERPMVSEPGTGFTYSGSSMILLGEIIKNATKMDIAEFSGKYLFSPLEVDSFNWWNHFKNGVTEAAGCLQISPRDMAKVGVTFLNKGTWKGKRIISEDWVNKSAVSYRNNVKIRIPGEDLGKVGYAYTWWTKEFTDSGRKISWYSANGWGGQKIIVIPDLDTVIVLTGGTFSSKVRSFKLLKKYIIPAIG